MIEIPNSATARLRSLGRFGRLPRLELGHGELHHNGVTGQVGESSRTILLDVVAVALQHFSLCLRFGGPGTTRVDKHAFVHGGNNGVCVIRIAVGMAAARRSAYSMVELDDDLRAVDLFSAGAQLDNIANVAWSDVVR